MDSSIGFFSPTIEQMTATEPAERQLALLLKAERLFEASIAKEGESESMLFLCNLLKDTGNNFDLVDEPDLLIRMIRASCTEQENKRFIGAPFGIFFRESEDDRHRKMNKHRAFWLDFMILVLADEAGMKLVEDKSVSGGSYA